MATTTIETLYLQYLGSITDKMTDDKSLIETQAQRIDDQFLRFGLTNEQMAKILSEMHVATSEFATKNANMAALDLIKIEKDSEYKDAQIEILNAELELKEKDLELKDKELELKEADLLLKEKDLELKEQELLKMNAEIDLMEAKIITESKQQLNIVADTALKTKKAATETNQTLLVASQKLLVDRQIQGYADNLLVKAAEYQGGLASFAVNSGSDTANEAISDFQTTINQIKLRA